MRKKRTYGLSGEWEGGVSRRAPCAPGAEGERADHLVAFVSYRVQAGQPRLLHGRRLLGRKRRRSRCGRKHRPRSPAAPGRRAGPQQRARAVRCARGRKRGRVRAHAHGRRGQRHALRPGQGHAHCGRHGSRSAHASLLGGAEARESDREDVIFESTECTVILVHSSECTTPETCTCIYTWHMPPAHGIMTDRRSKAGALRQVLLRPPADARPVCRPAPLGAPRILVHARHHDHDQSHRAARQPAAMGEAAAMYRVVLRKIRLLEGGAHKQAAGYYRRCVRRASALPRRAPRTRRPSPAGRHARGPH